MTSPPSGPIGVLLLNMGGPDSLDAVEPFLFNLFNDNDIFPLPLRGFLLQWPLARLVAWRRSRVVRGYYEKIGKKSPLGKITRLQARLLEQRLNRDLPPGSPPAFRTYVAMRYWHPFTDEALHAMQRDGVRRIVALSLYPHYTSATTGSSLGELKRRLKNFPALEALPLLSIDHYADEPAYIDAVTRRVRHTLHKLPEGTRRDATILFSAHGLPLYFLGKGDPYVQHLYTTITGVVARLTASEGYIPRWSLSFQSRAGPARWLEPSTEDELKRLAAAGHRDIVAVPIAFVSDHIETLYEIDMLFGDEARALGLRMRRAAALNGEPLFTEALAHLVERRLADAAALVPVATQHGNIALQQIAPVGPVGPVER